MAAEDTGRVTISVRDLVEFILRSGDIDTRVGRGMDFNAMQEGSRIHRKLQKAMGAGYRAEVSLKLDIPVTCDGESIILTVEGRADGIYTEYTLGEADGQKQSEQDVPASLDSIVTVYIDEIKTTYRDVSAMEAPEDVHRAQAMCYAYMYSVLYLNNTESPDDTRIGIRMTYCRQETEEVRYFPEVLDRTELSEWFDRLVSEYARWAVRQRKWERLRNATILEARFPFEYRPGQRDLVAAVYRSMERERLLFLEAPTGVGKTISTVFPTVRLLGEGRVEKIFYGTAKTIARTVAEETFSLLAERGMKLKTVTITSKEKLCVLEEPECNPVACPRAKGHFDRVNEAVFELLTHEESIDRAMIEQYAERFNVCPFEMCLDVSTWADAIICDYNYIFDPTVRLKRFFADERRHDYALLIDEAHNLVDRAREMYSAMIVKEDVLAARQALKGHRKFETALEACNKALLSMKRECDEFEVWEECNSFVMALMRFAGLYEDRAKELTAEQNEAVIELYFEARHFLEMHELMEDDYTICTDFDEQRRFRLTLRCMDPSASLKRCLKQAKGSVFFSATLLPVLYYRDQLGGSEEDYCVYAPSPFDTSRRLLMVAGDVSTKYTRRTDDEYARITDYICSFTEARKGNYMVYFPSYSMMEQVGELARERIPNILMQTRSMTEQEKEEFLNAFDGESDDCVTGFCVMGGIFSEGIDLRNDRLIGVAVVGTGLPQVCNERELFRGYFDSRNGQGFEYAYLYNGMNKVMQAAGRVIRTTEDIGAILLLDERFLSSQYRNLFPREWNDCVRVDLPSMKQKLSEFWRRWD